MKKLCLLLLLIPQASFACSPPVIQLPPEEMIAWNEANPCFMNTDEKIYNKLRAECLKKSDTPDDKKVIAVCNHVAYVGAKK